MPHPSFADLEFWYAHVTESMGIGWMADGWSKPKVRLFFRSLEKLSLQRRLPYIDHSIPQRKG